MPVVTRLTLSATALAILCLAACAPNRNDDMGAAPDRGDTTAVAVDTTAAAPDTTVAATDSTVILPDTGAVAVDTVAIHRPPPDTTRYTHAMPPPLDGAPGYAEVPVLFATDRGPSRSVLGRVTRYGSERGTLVWGKATVSIPKSHEAGHLEAPSVFRFEFRENPEKHVVLLGAQELTRAAWADTLRAMAAASTSQEALVFIHGYNVTFEDAARRAAQLSYDVAFDGVTVMYSWPSKGELNGYMADEATVEWTIPHLVTVLEQVVATTGVNRVHVIAHSMGNRALVRAVQAVAANHPDGPAFNQVVLAAPDIDAGVYQEQIAPALRAYASRVTLYASSKDAALMASSRLHQFRRAGYSGPDLVIADGIDTIDASNVDTDMLGHGYAASEKEVLDDLFALIRNKLAPSSRNLRSERRGAAAFWLLP